jgi:alanine racemase
MSASQNLPRRCWAEVNLKALVHNAVIARELAQSEFMAVVKANAYGHGAVEVVKALNGIASIFGVANLKEADEIRESGVSAPILILSACLPEEAEIAISRGYQVTVNSLAEAEAINRQASILKTKAIAHIVLDTGMGRMGFIQELWTAETAQKLAEYENIIWEGIGSHLPAPDEDEEFTHQQISNFHLGVTLALANGLKPHWVHLTNSAGLIGYKETREFCQLTRPGLMLYGINPMPIKADLRPALTWKTRIAMIRELPANHSISYGRTFITQRSTLVATLACGYADGYPRQLSGKGAVVLIQGQRCPLLGKVTMDQIMVDVTDLNEPASVGDEAILLGRQGDEEITANELAEKAGTISWHIFTGIGERVERVYI